MATIQDVFQLTKYRANKSGWGGYISPDDFNLLFPRSSIRYFNKLYGNQNLYREGNPIPPIAYPETIKISSSLGKFSTDPALLLPDINGKITKPDDLFYVDALYSYPAPGTAIGSLGTLVPGTGYTDGTYTLPLTGGSGGAGATAKITVAGGVVTAVQLLTMGKGYTVGTVLTAAVTGGTGFTITVLSLTGIEPTSIKRIEKENLADNLYSYYLAPDYIFPIYVEYETYIQFYPVDLGYVTLSYLREPTKAVWAYVLAGAISAKTITAAGTAYTNGTYTNVPLAAITGNGTGALATIVVAGNVVTTVTITYAGLGYVIGDTLNANPANIGGTGSGFVLTVNNITNARPVYDPVNSVDPEWSDVDIDEIIYILLADIGINARDPELENFSQAKTNTGI